MVIMSGHRKRESERRGETWGNDVCGDQADQLTKRTAATAMLTK